MYPAVLLFLWSYARFRRTMLRFAVASPYLALEFGDEALPQAVLPTSIVSIWEIEKNNKKTCLVTSILVALAGASNQYSYLILTVQQF